MGDNSSGSFSAVVSPATAITSLLILVVVCVVSNVVLLTALVSNDSTVLLSGGNGGKRSVLLIRCPNVDMLVSVVSVVSVVNCTTTGAIQTTSFLYGEWIFGDALCQLQGFLTSLMNLCTVWYVALLSFERYTHRLQPQEYPLTLSRLNLKVILVGILFVLLIAVSGPIYGWGEYSFIPAVGLCSLDLTSQNVSSHLALMLSVYVLVPSVCLCICYGLLLLTPEPNSSLISKDDVTSILAGRSIIYIFALASVTSLILTTPAHVVSVAICSGLHVTPDTIFGLTWLQTLGLTSSFPVCCLGCSRRLRQQFCVNLIGSVKSRCQWLQAPADQECLDAG